MTTPPGPHTPDDGSFGQSSHPASDRAPDGYGHDPYAQGAYAPPSVPPRGGGNRTAIIAAVTVVAVAAVAAIIFLLVRGGGDTSSSQQSNASGAHTPESVANDINGYLVNELRPGLTLRQFNDLLCSQYAAQPSTIDRIEQFDATSGGSIQQSMTSGLGSVTRFNRVLPSSIENISGNDAVMVEGTQRYSMRHERDHWRFCDAQVDFKPLDSSVGGLPR